MKKSLQVEEIHMSFLKLPVIKHPSYTIDNISGSLSFDQRLQDSQWLMNTVSDKILCFRVILMYLSL